MGYLLDEVVSSTTFKDPAMLLRLNELSELPDDDKRCILNAIDGLLQNARTKKAFATK